MNISFIKVEEEHIQALKEIYTYYIKHSTATFHIQEISDEEMRALLIFDDPRYESYGINLEGELCGYVILTQYKIREAFGQTAEITIYLKQGYEGKGLGKRALEFIEQRARIHEFHALMALICGENNGSIRLFEKNGYEKCAHCKEVGYKFDRWLDLVEYQKII